ncbi:protein FAR1-related sequence 9 [Tanacetum coccineum]
MSIISNGDEQLVVDVFADYLKQMQANNPSFYYAIGNGNVFWADSTFAVNYTHFGDTVRLHVSRRQPSFVSITGLNHHAQPILFGCGFLHSHSSVSYVWFLQNWLHAMSGKYPLSITTQPHHHIQIAVSQVLPQTRHRFCTWSIIRDTHDKLHQSSPTFDKEFLKCVYETDTVDEFESCWQALVDKNSPLLADNEWLQSIYYARHHWVPVYLKDTFFGELDTTTRPPEEEDESVFFLDGYVNETTSIQSLVKQYESAVTSWHEMELKADFETATTMPLLKTPSPMEKQAANLYTRRAFLKFQEELVETLANPATKLEDNGTVITYRVAKFGGDGQKAHIVKFNPFEMKAICSCHMFEFSGIICRHALSVFRAQNVLTLPSQYILKRWTRDAKRGDVIAMEEEYLPNNSQDPLTVRYNNLRHEAMKFVEQGAKSIHIYNEALDALQVAAKKVAASKKQSSHGCAISNGETDVLDKGHQSRGEKEKKIRELTSELDDTNQRCEGYRANLLAVLRDMEEQKLKLSVKVQNARLSLKE